MSKAQNSVGSYQPEGRLVPVMAASAGADASRLALRMGRFAASLGETVLILDGRDGEVMDMAGIVYSRTLTDAIEGTCDLRDCMYITSNEHFTITALGEMGLGEAVGTFASLSLEYDWVFAVPPSGLSQANARLAAGSDAAVIAYETQADLFMRAYWIMDAVRARNPRFDPHTVSFGDSKEAVETALLLEATVRDHLGASPIYAGHESDRDRVQTLLQSMREHCRRQAA